MRMEYLIVGFIIMLIALFAIITFAGDVFPAFPKAVKDFLSAIGPR